MSAEVEPPRKPRRPYDPGRFRQRSHDEAHAAGLDSTPAQPIPDLPLVPRGHPILVADPDAFDALIVELRSAGLFAYDSEFIGELTYTPRLCLLQVATAAKVWLIDPLADIDLAPFWDLLCDPSITKIVHAGQQDIEPVFRLTGRPAANMFDTQVAAGFIRLAYPVSLSKLVMELTGARLMKGLTFTHWDQRPLSEQQLRYAADDVRYLLAVHATLVAELQRTGHTAWADEECAELCDPSQFGFDVKTSYQRVRGAGSLQPRNQSVLKALANWRDQQARTRDIPARTFLKDEVLLELARHPVKSVEKLDRVRGLPRPVESEFGQTMVDLTLEAMNAPLDNLAQPEGPEPTPRQRFDTDAAWAVIQSICLGQGIDPALVTSRQDVSDFFRAWQSKQPTDTVRMMRGWRLKAVGQKVLDVLGGKSRLSVHWDGGLHTQFQIFRS